MRNFSLLLILVMVSMAKPAWVETMGEDPSLDNNQFITGFGMSTIPKNQSISESIFNAKSEAKGNLSKEVLLFKEDANKSLKNSDRLSAIVDYEDTCS